MNIWIPRIIREIKRLRRMRRWAIQHRDPVIYHLVQPEITWWKKALRKELER